jgi:hypothetical protein
MVDLARVKSNVAKMAAQGAPEADIDAYIAAEGTNVDAVRSFNGKSISLLDALQHQTKTGKYADPSRTPRLKGNPQASVLPGPLGQFQNFTNAFQNAATQGMTANFADEMYAGVTAPFKATGDAIQGRGFDLGRSYLEGLQGSEDISANTQALNPDAAKAGAITGGLVLGGSLSKGGASLIPAIQTSLPRLAAAGAAEGALYGGAYGLGEPGPMNERLGNAARGVLYGAGTGAVMAPALNRMFAPSVPKSAQIVDKGLRRDQIDPNDIQNMLGKVGDGAVIADLGPNMQQQAAAIATEPGAATRVITDAMKARGQGANARIKSGVNTHLGPARDPAQVNEAIQTQMDNLEPFYTGAMKSAQPVDVTALARNIEGNAKIFRGDAQRELTKVRQMLNDADTGGLTEDPAVLFEVRKAIDASLSTETNTNVIRALGGVRKKVDDELARVSPDLKKVDARYAELARQKEALVRGGQLLDDGKTSMSPDALDTVMRSASRGQNSRQAEGLRSEIERIIGTKANDRVALQQIIKGEGSWNYEKLVKNFGQDRADKLFQLLRGERLMAETENLALTGARTSPLNSAKADLAQQVKPQGIFETAGNLDFGTAAVKLADKMFAGVSEAGRQRVVKEVADALMSNGLPPKMAFNIAILRSVKKPVLPALLAAQQAQGVGGGGGQ